MSTNGYRVYTTTNYAIFKKMKGNRDVSDKRKDEIKKSIKNAGYVRNPIIVNNNMEVVDGQGRLAALKELGMPVDYIIDPNANIDQVIEMNNSGEQWDLISRINSYAELGDPEYIRLREVVNNHYILRKSTDRIGIGMIIAVCAGTMEFANESAIKNGRFKFGRKDYERAIQYLESFLPIKKRKKGQWGGFYKVLLWAFDDPRIDAGRVWTCVNDKWNSMGDTSSKYKALDSLEAIYSRRGRNHVKVKDMYDKWAESRKSIKGWEGDHWKEGYGPKGVT